MPSVVYSACSQKFLGLGAQITGFVIGNELSLIVGNSNAIVSLEDDVLFNSQAIVTNTETIVAAGITVYSGRVFFGNMTLDGSMDRLATIHSSPSQTLHLTMTNEADIRFDAGSTELKPTDTLRVFGINNTILVSETLTVSGTIVLQPFGELTFIFDDFADDPKIIFNTDFNLTLSPNTRLVFQGNGTVEFKDGFSIFMDSSGGQDKPELIIKDSASFTISAPAGVTSSTTTVSGKGVLFIDSGGEVRIDSRRHLILGGQGTNVDDLDIIVDRAGVLKANEIAGQISMHNTVGTLDFEQGGRLEVVEGAVIEINALDRATSSGNISSWKIDTDGQMIINGELIIGENADEATFDWDSRRSSISGTGVVTLAEQLEFAGQPLGVFRYFDSTSITAELLVRQIVNTVNVLSDSTVFTNFSGANILRIKSTDVLGLPASSIILKQLRDPESSTGTDRIINEISTAVLGITGRGDPFRYLSSGARI